MQRSFIRLLLLSSLYGLMIFTGCGVTTLQSEWRGSGITIDGSDTEWGSSLLLFEKEKVAVGIANDESNLYLCIKCMDRSLQQKIIRGGLTVWLDSAGSDHKIFGIHFPVGMQSGDSPRRMEDRADSENPDQASREAERDFLSRMYEMEVLGGENMVLEKFQNLHPSGMQLAISDSTGPIVYELKVPFRTRAGQRYAIGTDAGGTIGIGFETGQLNKRPARQEMSGEGGEGGGMGGGMGGGRRGGGMGGGRRGGGMRGGGSRSDVNEDPLQLWAKIHLATAVTPAQ
ncbi:MAG TPA: hypothetical protein VMW43_01370 [Bacteroidota bacterium]|nr:hypothetical protein [Bacteroidota bacterium]